MKLIIISFSFKFHSSIVLVMTLFSFLVQLSFYLSGEILTKGQVRKNNLTIGTGRLKEKDRFFGSFPRCFGHGSRSSQSWNARRASSSLDEYPAGTEVAQLIGFKEKYRSLMSTLFSGSDSDASRLKMAT